jgi:hypothetical protein
MSASANYQLCNCTVYAEFRGARHYRHEHQLVRDGLVCGCSEFDWFFEGTPHRAEGHGVAIAARRKARVFAVALVEAQSADDRGPALRPDLRPRAALLSATKDTEETRSPSRGAGVRPAGNGHERARPGGSAPPDRDLVTVPEFASSLHVAESTVWDWLTRGLPAVKTKGLGRRILRRQGEAWLIEGGPTKSRIVKRLTRRNAGAHARREGGGSDGSP